MSFQLYKKELESFVNLLNRYVLNTEYTPAITLDTATAAVTEQTEIVPTKRPYVNDDRRRRKLSCKSVRNIMIGV